MIKSYLSVTTLLTLFIVAGSLRAQRLPAGPEVAGVPWVGGKGITETVTEIMARGLSKAPGGSLLHGEEHELRVMPGRRSHPQNPDAAAISHWPLSKGLPTQSVETLSPMNPQTIGTDFLGARFSETPGYVPPDCAGTVGPTQYLVCVNGRIRTFTKSGVADGAINTFTDTFFSSVIDGSSASDPHVVFDRLSQRWFVVMINVNTPNRVMIAVSSGATITSGSSFTFYEFQHDSVGARPNGDTGGFADYPTLGVDNNALYIGVNVFNAAGTAYIGSSAFVVRKSSVTGGGPIVVTAFREIGTGTVSGPYTPEGVSNDDASATQGYFVGVDTRLFGLVQVRRISNPGGTPTISSNLSITVPETYYPSLVPAQGSTPLMLDAVDDRLCTAILKNGSLWVSHAISVDASGVADASATARDAVRFYEINNLTATPALVQSGTLFSSASSNPRFFWNPSIAMSGQGNVAIGCSYAGAGDFAGVAYAGRLATDPAGTVQSATQFASSSAYNIQIDTADGAQRWGDFSTTSLDPNDNMTIWTIQEYCDATNSWGVRVTQLKAPPPATPSGSAPSSAVQGVTNLNVVLTGTTVSGSGFYDPGSGFPNRLTASVNGGGVTVNSALFTDPTHLTLNITVAGGAATGGRTITITNPDGQAATSATALLTITPNNCPTITIAPSTLPDGSAGNPYSQSLTPNGGTSPYSFSITGGALPSGLSLSSSGLLSGSPAFGGLYNFTVTASDSHNCAGSQLYTLTVTGCPQITLAPLTIPNGSVGTAYTQTITASGGRSPYAFTVTSGSLPSGISLSGTGGLSGSPTATGTFNFTVTATDSDLCTGHRDYALTIDPFNLNSINLTALGSAYTQDFNTLASTGTSGTLPTGWFFSESGANANATYTASTGLLNAGDTYSFGASSAPDRALGGVQSGNLNPTFGASVTNNTGGTITSLLISYTGEQWRLGATGRTDRIDFQLSTDATSLTTGTYADFNNLDFSGPVTAGSTGALDGNSNANRTSISSTISGLNITNGSTFFIRWSDLNATGADDGLAIDDFSMTPSGAVTTNPSGTGASNPSTVSPGGPTLLTVTVTPGTNPASTGIGVTANLSSIGGLASQVFFDDGTQGDVTGGDNIFSFGTNVAVGTSPGLKSMPVTITDAQSRTGNGSITLTVPCPAITLSPPPLSDGKVGLAYDDTLTASGGSPPYAFTVSAGALPTGVSLSSAGVLAGTPTSANTFSFSATATDVHNCTAVQSYSITIAPDSNVSVSIHLNSSWNLVSNPIGASNDSVNHLFPGAMSNAFLYATGYQISDRIENGNGYWLKFGSGAVVKLSGDLRLLDSIDVTSGWNLIGSISRTISASSLRTAGTTITSRIFGYGTAYSPADSLRPGAGYWVKCDQAGKIVLATDGPVLSRTSAMELNVGSMNRLIISDAAGNTQTLYFGAHDPVSPDRYELPPVPPSGTFDVRFTSQRSLETYPAGSPEPLGISVLASAYPLSVHWELSNGREKFDLVSSDAHRMVSTFLARQSGSMKIRDPQAAPLILKPHEESGKPAAVTLMDNYPDPFNPRTVIRFHLSTEGRVSLNVYNTLGEKVATLIDRQVQEEGEHEAEFSADNLPSGIYLYELVSEQTGGGNLFRQVKKMALIR